MTASFLAIDTETTGLDFWHGCRPFFVTTCDQDGNQEFWEWNVDPLTRQVDIPEADVVEIRERIEQADRLVGHNIRFDARALEFAGVIDEWPWHKTEDTLIAGHMLNSALENDLSNMVNRYVPGNVSIWQFEDAVKIATQDVRRWATHHRKNWKQVRGKGESPEIPSSYSGKEIWRMDYWLPRAAYRLEPELADEHPDWDFVTRQYGNADSASTAMLWPAVENLMTKAGLMAIYRERMKMLPALYRMERKGPSVSENRLRELEDEFQTELYNAHSVMVNLAKADGFELSLPKGSSVNNSLRDYCFGVMQLPVVSRSDKTQEPSLNAPALEAYTRGEHYLDNDRHRMFVSSLADSRKFATSLSYMEQYRRFWVSPEKFPTGELFWTLHPGFNPTGTATLRESSFNPNAQNVSKKEDRNLRFAFGPKPGREWVSIDYENIELRIPAYECGEEKMIALFEKPNEPPYWGSYHYLNASIVYPAEFWPLTEFPPDDKRSFKSVYKSTLYQWDKNGGFAIQYGAQKKKADATFRVNGAYDALNKQLPKVAQLREAYVAKANRYGYVETIPDHTVDPKRGYPMALLRYGGRVSPTEPFSYHIQGTACWAKNKALVRCDGKLEEWRRADGFDGHIILEVHDELVFDFPAGTCAREPWRIREIVRLMELSGSDLTIPMPLTVSPSFHPVSWSAAEEFPVAL